MYRVSLKDFEGPLDLLLFFIKRDELNIYDIPIAQIADEFLEYVRILEQVDLDSAADFIYMAALLISIKARMLLPVFVPEEETEVIDPREELVQRLVEYIRFKEASRDLEDLHTRRGEHFERGQASAPDVDASPEEVRLVGTTVFDLISCLGRILKTAPDPPVHRILRIEYSIEVQRDFVQDRLRDGKKLRFVDLVDNRSKPFVIATFLASLELARQGWLKIIIDRSRDSFWLKKAETLVNIDPADDQVQVFRDVAS